MDNLIDFESAATEGAAIIMERTPQFYEWMRALSDYIKALPLTVEQNDELVALAAEQTIAAEQSGYTFGLKMGLDLGRDLGGGDNLS